MTETPDDRAVTPASTLVPDALEANRAGRLTDTQRQNLRQRSRGRRKREVQFAAVLTVVGLLVWFAPGPSRYATIKPLLGIAALIIAGALVVRAFVGADSLTEDLRSGRVESAEGAITKWIVTTAGGTTGTLYYLQVGKVRVDTGRTFYQAIPAAGMVRIFYLPRTHHLVNLEQLPDLPLPEGALTDPRIAMSRAKEGIVGGLFGDPSHGAEARAELTAIGHAMTAQFAKGAVPPPAEARDPRPLAEAIVGTWKNQMMTITFSADGSIAATLPGGMRRSGHWSVDSAGHLSSDVTGSGPADAWVAGNQLTVVFGKNGIKLERVV